MKWVGYLQSSLASAWSFVQPFCRWLGQPQPVRGWLLVLLVGLLPVLGYQMASNPTVHSLTDAGAGSASSIGSGHPVEVDSVRVAVGTLIHVATKHVENADSAEAVRRKITAAVDSLPADQLQHIIDSLFAEPGLATPAKAPADHAH